MTTVYLVTSGEYSDERIDGVFSSRENAELYMKTYPCSAIWSTYNDIIECVLDRYISQMERGLFLYDLDMNKSGNIQYDVGLYNEHVGYEEDPQEEGIDIGEQWRDGYRKFRLWARDEKHAVKICNDRRAQMIANGEW